MGNEASRPLAFLPTVPSYTPSQPGHEEPLGRHIPAEIVNIIYAYALTNDNDVVVLPRSVRLIGAHNATPTRRLDHVYVTSSCALHRTCKASRRRYYGIFLAKVRDLDFQNLRVLVEDFNFGPYVNGLVRRLSTSLERVRLKHMAFTMRLIWTEEYLHDPSTEHLEQWLDFTDDDKNIIRKHSFDYDLDPMPAKYVHPFTMFISERVYDRKFVLGPELQMLVTEFERMLQSNEIYLEGSDVKFRGKWVEGNWVVEVDDGTPMELEDEDEEDVEDDAMSDDESDLESQDGDANEGVDEDDGEGDVVGIGTRVKTQPRAAWKK